LNAIDAGKEREVFFDAQIVIQREFLGHAPVLTDGLRRRLVCSCIWRRWGRVVHILIVVVLPAPLAPATVNLAVATWC
jgi:hypothetical protein